MNIKAIVFAVAGATAAAFAYNHSASLTTMFGATSKNKVDIMAFVPANTPYLFGTLEPIPESARNRLKSYAGPMTEVFEMAMREGMMEAQQKALSGLSDDADRKAMMASYQEGLNTLGLMGKIMIDDAQAVKAGFTARLNGAFYGVGMVPVFRIELSDEAKALATFQTLFTNLEASNKLSHEQKQKNRKEGDEPLKPYKAIVFKPENFRNGKIVRFGNDEKGVGVLIFENNQLVISLVPNKDQKAMLDLVAPASPLGKSSVASSKLAGLKKQGYTGYMLGFMESQPIARYMAGERTSLEKALFGAAENSKALSKICQSELDGIAAKFPRLTMGSGVWNGDVMETKMVMELAPKIASDYQSITTTIPGYGAGKAARFSIALDLMKTFNLVRKHAQQVIDVPYQCEQFADMNEGAKKAVEGLSNPGLGMATMYKGMGFAIETMDFKPNMDGSAPTTKNMAMTAAIFADQPVMALGMLQMRLPDLANLNLKDDGVPVALPASMLQGAEEVLSKAEAFAAMNKQMLILSGGANAQANIKQALAQKPFAAGTFMEFAYGGEIFKAVAAIQKEALMADANTPEKKALMEKLVAAQMAMWEQIERADATFQFTPQGMEMQTATRFSNK